MIVDGLTDDVSIPYIVGVCSIGLFCCFTTIWSFGGGLYGLASDDFDDKDTTDVAIKMAAEPKRRGLVLWLIEIVLVALIVMYVLLLVPLNNQFSLRQDVTAPIGFTRCNQSLVDDGFCQPTLRYAFYIGIYVLSALIVAVFLKWNFRSTGIYLGFWAVARLFLYLFYQFEDEGARWTFYGIATLFGVGTVCFHIMSLVDSYYNTGERSQPLPDMGYSTQRPDAPYLLGDNYGKIEGGKWVNTINYKVNTAEFWINISYPFWAVIFPWLFAGLGTAGGKVISYAVEAGLYFAFDWVIFIIIFAIILLYTVKKSEAEIKTVNSDINQNSVDQGMFNQNFDIGQGFYGNF